MTGAEMRAAVTAYCERVMSLPVVEETKTMIVPPRECAPQFWEMLEEHWPEAVKGVR